MADVRLIDANALKAKLYSLLKIEEAPPMFIEGLETALAVADVAPTIDAVPVVRCRECKHRARTNSTLGFGWCGKFGNVMRDTDFCSWGERNMDGGAENG